MLLEFNRYPNNPLIEAHHLPFPAHSVFNPGAVLLPDGKTALLLRVEDHRGLSAIYLARSADGRTDWTFDPSPMLAPDPDDIHCEWGFEDARVSFVAELDRYVITCTAYGGTGPSVYLTTTKDFHTFDRGNVVLTPEDKNAAVFPRRVNGEWLLLHRPAVASINSMDIWMSRSNDDMESWRQPEQVLHTRGAGWWDAARIGIGPPPIETPEGWLQIYHGVRVTMAGPIYRVGAALLDLDEPHIVRARLDRHLLSPSEQYERVGDVANVVFPAGAIQRGSQLDLYYGAADTSVCVASIDTDELLGELLGR